MGNSIQIIEHELDQSRPYPLHPKLSNDDNILYLDTFNPNSINAPSLNSIIDQFILNQRSVHTQRSYRFTIKQFLQFTQLSHINAIAEVPFYEMVNYCLNYIESITKRDDIDKNIINNAATVNLKSQTVSSFFTYLVNIYGYKKNPMAQFKKRKLYKHSQTPSLEKDELSELFQHLIKDSQEHPNNLTKMRDSLIVRLLFILALRRNELVSIKIKNINFRRNTITVINKGGDVKILPLDQNMMSEFTEYLAIKESRYGVSEYLFTPFKNTTNGNIEKPLDTTYIYKLVKRYAKRLDLDPKISPHSFRRSFVEQSLLNNEDMISIINSTGHSTVDMVRYYDTRNKLKHNAIHKITRGFM